MKKLINVCGTARCGSTMIDLILGNSPQGFSLGEINAWFRPYRSHHFQIKCSCQGIECPWDVANQFREEDFYSNFFELMDVDFLIDSSKDLPWVVDNNISSPPKGIEVYNVLLYKEPISFFHSFWKRGFSINSVRKNVFNKYYSRFFETGLPFVALNYNDFVRSPHSTLKQLCESLDIPFFEGKKNFWTKEQHHLFGSIGTRKQIEGGGSEIRSKESFSTEYEKIIPDILLNIEKDKTFQKILSKLKDNDITNKNESTKNNKPIKKPLWYYFLKIKQKMRQNFPVKWKYEQ